MVSAEYPGREVFLKDLIAKMSGSDRLPSVAEIERVWYEILREVKEQGTISRFSAEVATPSGELSQRDVVRVGAFNVIDTDGNYLSFSNNQLTELPRQPGGAFGSQGADLAGAARVYISLVLIRPDRPVALSSRRSLIAPRWPSAGIRVAMWVTQSRQWAPLRSCLPSSV